MFNSNVPSLVWNDAGIQLPEEDAILNGVIEDLQTAFGNQLKFYNANGDFLLATPQGQLATSMAAIISDRNRLLVYYVNQVDPSYAAGRMQDAIGRIYFLERQPAQNTKVMGVCQGASGTVIPKGTKVQDSQGQLYEADQDYVIGQGGTVSVSFVCIQAGNIACPAHDLKMYQLISGWDSVDNPQEAIIGRSVESQIQFEQRRRLSVAKNSIGQNAALLGALLAIPNVLDAYVVDNPLNASQVIQGVTLPPHSVYCVVDGGEDQEIGSAILSRKAPGCDTAGSVTVTVQDKNAAYHGNGPSYEFHFDRPVTTPVYVSVIIGQNSQVPVNASQLISEGVARWIRDPDTRPRLGSTLYASRIASYINQNFTWAEVIEVLVGTDPHTGKRRVTLPLNQIATCMAANISVAWE